MTNKADFYGRDFLINPDVLVPRPETEQLIDAVLSLAGKAYLPGVKASRRALPERAKILDVGTGSGCIAATLKLEIDNAEVAAIDLSEKALDLARRNAERLGAGVRFIHSDLLTEVGEIPGWTYGPDLVAANLPYVDRNWDWLDKKALEAEPEMALFAEKGGLEFIEKLIDQLDDKIRGGWWTKYLLLEADPSQHDAVISLTKKMGWKLDDTRGFILQFSR